MLIPELRYPGSWPDGLAPQDSHRLTRLLYLLESSLIEAALALQLFQECSEAARQTPPSEQDWQAEADARRAIEHDLQRAIPGGLSPEDRWRAETDCSMEASQELKRRQWREGRVPDAYLRRLPFMYARGFLYALDQAAKALGVLALEPWSPASVADLKEKWDEAFPNLRHVRDSAHHAEDRVRGVGRNRRQIEPAPVSNEAIEAPSGALILDSLINNRYGNTMADGHYGEVEVSAAALMAARDVVQAVFDSWEWRGPARWVP